MSRLLVVPSTFAAGYLGILRGNANNPPTAGDIENCFKVIVAATAAGAATVAANAFGINPGLVLGEDGNLRIWDGSALVLPDRDFGTTGLSTDVIAESTAAAGVTVDGCLIKDGRAALLATAAMFTSTEQTGTGSAQNVAHGFGTIPSAVIIYPTSLAADLVAGYTVTRGTDTTTNIVVTVTSGAKFIAVAFK